MPGRSVKVRRCPPSETSQRSASAGWTRADGSNAVRPSQTCARTDRRLGVALRAPDPSSPALTRRSRGPRRPAASAGAMAEGWGVTESIASRPTPIISATRTTGPTMAATAAPGVGPSAVATASGPQVSPARPRPRSLPHACAQVYGPSTASAPAAGPGDGVAAHPTRPGHQRTAIVAWMPMQAARRGASSADRRPTRPQEVQAGHAYPYHVL